MVHFSHYNYNIHYFTKTSCRHVMFYYSLYNILTRPKTVKYKLQQVVMFMGWGASQDYPRLPKTFWKSDLVFIII